MAKWSMYTIPTLEQCLSSQPGETFDLEHELSNAIGNTTIGGSYNNGKPGSDSLTSLARALKLTLRKNNRPGFYLPTYSDVQQRMYVCKIIARTMQQLRQQEQNNKEAEEALAKAQRIIAGMKK